VATEVLINNTSVSNMIRKDQTHQIPNAIETGKEDGMIAMKDTLQKLFDEQTISEELYNYHMKLLDK
jgi:twitching motility protein PilT